MKLTAHQATFIVIESLDRFGQPSGVVFTRGRRYESKRAITIYALFLQPRQANRWAELHRLTEGVDYELSIVEFEQ